MEIDVALTLPQIALATLLGYVIGSIPFGLVLTRLAGYGDIRAIGSGNIGATNVLRTGNKPLALATLILDTGKGAAAALIFGYFIDPTTGIIAGVTAVIGHNFPVWLKFKGGKGVATTLGTLIAIAWPVGLGACLTWLMIALLFRVSSLSALIALATAPLYAYLLSMPQVTIAAAILAILGWIRHHSNIRRLVTGTEPKIGQKKS